MVGASVAGNTLPTNWTRQNSSGLTQTVVGVGVENGLQYVDINLSGIATGANDAYSYDNSIVASISQTWTNSLYFKLISSSPNAVRLATQEFNSAVFLNVVTQDITPTTSLARYAQTKTLVGTGVNNVRAMIYVNFVIGTTYNTTIRLAAPQMELGAYATTFIPTTTAAVTRLPDSASKADVASLIGQTQGTLYAEVSMSNWESPNRLIAVSDGTTNNRIVILQSTANRFRVLVTNGTVGQVDFSSGTLTNGNYKLALAYAENNFTLFINGIEAGNDLSGTVPACSDIYLGKSESSSPSQFIANPIAQAAIFPTRLSNEELVTITTL
jgi:hypothetical protein